MNRQPRAFKADTVVKVGRLDSANQPISPLRKQKPRKTNLHGVAAAVAATGRRIGGKK